MTTEREPIGGEIIPLFRQELEPATDGALEGHIVEDDEDFDDDAPYTVREHALFVVAGTGEVVRKVWQSRSTSVYDRMMQAAAATGDHPTALEWEQRRAQFQSDRHARRFDWLGVPAAIVRNLKGCAIIAGGGPLVLGILLTLATKDPAMLAAPYMWIARTAEITVLLVSLLWWPTLLIVGAVGLRLLWRTGVLAAENGDIDWLPTAADVDMDIEIDETTIGRALGGLRIPQISEHIKHGLPFQFIVPARRDGRGTFAAIRLPVGVAAETIVRPNRRAQLASGLYRATKETWPAVGAEAGILDLWIADKGALEVGAGPYPLLDEGVVDVFQGVPFGRTLRGDSLVAPVMERNTIVGGIPGQGKSSAARIIMAGAMLDPSADLRIWVPDTNFDFENFKPRCSRYVMGAEDEHIEQILLDLRELYAEVQERGELLVEHQEPQVSRALADLGIGMHPIFGLLEEAHLAICHKVHGEEISQLLIDIVRLGRKRGIHMIVSTQAPTKDSMPRDVTRNCSNGVAFAVGDHVANDALLGQGAYRGGHRATELIPGVDAGTALVKGFTGERSVMVQAYFLSVRKGNDQVTPLVQRSLAEIERRGRVVPGSDRARRELETRELLDDLESALDGVDYRVKLTDVVAGLRRVAPGWEPYKRMSGTDLKPHLKGFAIRVYTTGNVLSVDPADVRTAVSRASTADLDEQ